MVQLDKYEAALDSIQLSQNLTSDCLLISGVLPVFLHDVIIKLFCFDLQNNFMITSCERTGKNR